jgi:hypothetical protein
MLRNAATSGALLCCLIMALVGCSAATVDGGPTSATTEAHETTSSAVSSTAGQAEQEPAGIHSSGGYWALDSLDALNTLMANADGYVAYRVFEAMPSGFKVVQASCSDDLSSYDFTMENEQGQLTKLFVFSGIHEQVEPPVGSQEIMIEGVTYYYAEELDNDGGVLLAGLTWGADDAIFIVHIQEAITPEVIRKYSQMKKVEFNVGQEAVGYAAGTPLISDTDKIERLVRENSGIIYVDPTVDTMVDTAG